MSDSSDRDDTAVFWSTNVTPSTPSEALPSRESFHAAASSLLNRIEVEGELARGGTSTVFRVRDQFMRRILAMKVLSTHDGAHSQIHFLREAQVLGQLDHANIPPVYDIGVNDAGKPSFTMKLVRGETLAEILHRRRPPSTLGQVLDIVLKACDGVAFAHSRGVVHRDLKPENIMVGEFGQVYVMDWGCSRLIPTEMHAGIPGADPAQRVICDELPELDRPGYVVGTLAYMPPEQALGRTDLVGPTADVYTLGGTLYHALTGKPPHAGRSERSSLARAKLGETAPLQPQLPSAPPGLCRIVERALATDPAARYQTVDELARELRSFISNGALLATRRFPAGTIIMEQGDPSRSAFIVVEGRCRVYRRDGEHEVTLRELGPGDVFGETGIITAKPRSASVAALDDVLVTVVPNDALTDALSLGSWIGQFVRALAERFREADELISKLQGPR
jgi:serine/threonine-protein kinase